MKKMALTIALVSTFITTTTFADLSQKDSHANNPKVLPLSSNPFGQGYKEWAADFARFLCSIPYDRNPFLVGNSNCTQPQLGKVWFVGTGSSEAECEVPKGKAIFVHMGSYVNTHPCPDPAFTPAPGRSLEEFLVEGAKFVVDYYVNIDLWPNNLTIDDKFVIDGLKQRVTTGLFTLRPEIQV